MALAGALLGSVCLTATPLVARQIVDDVIASGSQPLWPLLVLLVALAAAAFGFAYLRRYRGGRVALHVQNDLRVDMHHHLQRMDLGSLDEMPTGQLVARTNSDSTLVQSLLNMLPIMTGNLIMMMLSIAVMIALSPPLALVSLVIVPVLLLLSYRMRSRVFPSTWDAQQREGDLAQIVDEAVGGVRIVKAFGQERRELERLAASAGRLYGSQLRAVRIQSRYQPLLKAVPALGQVAILALGGWLALDGAITLGTFLAFSSYVAALMAPARQLAGILVIGQQARAGVERIFQLLDTDPAIRDAPDAVELSPGGGRIDLDRVRFGYEDGVPVLDDVDLHVAAGERVALVGPSGSGKSTLAMMIPRFHDPDCGQVSVEGRDVRAVTLRSLRGSIGMVFEESFLFFQSVRDNIAYGRPDASDAEVEAAARAAHADDFIHRLPAGYDTVVGERGLNLSGGQRQRIALARALLADPRILVLDDATSSVDAATEEAIHADLDDRMAGRTVILIAHRPSTLRLADRVIVMDRGRIVETGTNDELLARSELYRGLIAGPDADEEIIETATDPAGTTSAAWRAPRRPAAASGGRVVGSPGIGPGLGRGGGSWRAGLAPTPDLLARVAALPPVRDEVEIDLPHESRHDPRFSLRRLLREFRRPLLAGLVLVVLDALAGIAGPVLVKSGIDDGVAAGSVAVLAAASGVYLLVVLADMLDQMAETFITGRMAQRVMLSLRIRIFAHLQRLSIDFYEREMAGRIMTRMTTDVDQFSSLIENGLLTALVAFVTFAGVGVTLLVVSLPLGLCTLSVVVPLAIATVIFRRKASRLYDLSRERIAILNADFQESLSGVRESQAFVHETATNDHFAALGGRYLSSRIAAQRLVATYFPFVQFLSAIADAIVLGVGAGMIASGNLTTGALIAFLLYIDMFFSPIQQLSQVFDSWQQTRVSVSRIGELMRIRTLTPPPERPHDPGRLRGEIAVDDVRFAYPVAGAGGEALSGVRLHVAAEETVALVGETGAGKSTVVKLLSRLYDPDAGSVRIDGHDLRRLDTAAFRRQLGYVPQEPFLFTGTVRDNIAYGRPDASDAEVEAAARAVGAHEVIAGLDGGYRHEIIARGRSLSSGQRQLIALARAHLVDPAVLLLDEATSNLDLATESRVSTAMNRLAHGRTTILIAHRLQTARAADRIVVLDRGRIVESGTHEELVSAGGHYADMWAAYEETSRRARAL